MTTIRIPARLAFYMESTGWGQGSETPIDPPRVRLLSIMGGNANADGSYSVGDPSPQLLARLWWEANHLSDGIRYGDADPDSLADYNAGQAMIRRVEKALGRSLTHAQATEEMHGHTLGDTCYECGVGDLDSSG